MTLAQAKQLIAVYKNVERVPREYGPILIHAANVVRNAMKKKVKNPSSDDPILVYEGTNRIVKIGDKVKDFRGDVLTVAGFELPRHSGSTGRVIVKERIDTGEIIKSRYYPSVIGAVWVKSNKQANPRKPVLVYGAIGRIEGTKTQKHICDSKCKSYGHRYYHNFSSKPRMYGLPDGSLLITKRRI
jgi:hypothetical protein